MEIISRIDGDVINENIRDEVYFFLRLILSLSLSPHFLSPSLLCYIYLRCFRSCLWSIFLSLFLCLFLHIFFSFPISVHVANSLSFQISFFLFIAYSHLSSLLLTLTLVLFLFLSHYVYHLYFLYCLLLYIFYFSLSLSISLSLLLSFCSLPTFSSSLSHFLFVLHLLPIFLCFDTFEV
uniref:Uncharacterized protein n=1 Tax=Octopus bimaculoides TaxID=37653 RepID=A0A0L8IAS8_OCTBM